MKHYPALYHDGQTRQALAGRARATGHVAILMAVKDGAPYLEETYYCRFDPPYGFAMHHTYRVDSEFAPPAASRRAGRSA